MGKIFAGGFFERLDMGVAVLNFFCLRPIGNICAVAVKPGDRNRSFLLVAHNSAV
jgi:hypothetical protein